MTAALYFTAYCNKRTVRKRSSKGANTHEVPSSYANPTF